MLMTGTIRILISEIRCLCARGYTLCLNSNLASRLWVKLPTVKKPLSATTNYSSKAKARMSSSWTSRCRSRTACRRLQPSSTSFSHPQLSRHIDDNCLGMLVFFGHGFALRHKCFDMQANSIFSHCNSLFEGLSLCHATRKSGHCNRIASLVRIRMYDDGILIVAHCFILQIQSSSLRSSLVSLACSRIDSNVLGLSIVLACLGTVT